MKILVCFKIVPDLDLLPEKDWVTDENLQVEAGHINKMWNCFDESALELALKLSDDSEGFPALYQLTALTIGNDRADSFLKTLYALKYQKAVRIENKEDIRFLPEVVAGTISEYVKRIEGQDVILLGKQSTEGDNGKTPLLLAELLQWPCITQVMKVEPADAGMLTITSMVDGGKLVQKITPPCVLSVGNAPNSYLRVPTLKDRMNYGRKEIQVHALDDLCGKEQREQAAMDYRLISLSYIDKRRKGIILQGDSLEEKVEKLYSSYLKERLKNI